MRSSESSTPTQKSLPRGSRIIVRGQLDTMKTSYTGLAAGLAFAILLIYFLIVVKLSVVARSVHHHQRAARRADRYPCCFCSSPTPGSACPALMGSIMCMGIATSNSILVVAFARERLSHHNDALQAAIESGYTRFRPVVMTALAMMIGMVPMAMGFGEGGEQNAPLGARGYRRIVMREPSPRCFLFPQFSVCFTAPVSIPALQPSRSGVSEPIHPSLEPVHE